MVKFTHGIMILALGFAQQTQAQIDSASQPSSEQLAQHYPSTFFGQYAPQTALDMVKRLPGFILIEADDDIRGFASGAGNVLIDGARPTTKSGGIAEALSRIPATQVQAISLVRGGGGDTDTAGQAVVANVLRHQSTAAQRVENRHWLLALREDDNGKLSPRGEFTLSRQLGAWASALNINAKRSRTPRVAKVFNYDHNQQLINSQDENRPSTVNEAFISADGKRQYDNGALAPQSLNINGRMGWSQYIPETFRQTSDQNDLTQSHFYNHRDSQYYAAELGIDWIKPISSHWQWRLRNLNNSKNWFVDTGSTISQANQEQPQLSALRFDEHSSEHIIRTSIGRTHQVKNSAPWALSQQQYGAELAYSQMHSGQKRYANATDNPDMTLLNATAAEVAEKRAEVFANFSWRFNRLKVETGLAAEHSQLTVSGDNSEIQSLFFLKPSLALIFDRSDDSQYRFTLRRSVGQLDFSDFAASADLVNDRAFSGNPQLRPDTQVQATLAFDQHFGAAGAVSIELYQQWRSDVLEQIQLPSGDHGLGNAGDAKVQGLKLSANLPLDRWLDHGLLSIKADFVRSSFADPISAQSRSLTGLSSPELSIDLRQDIIDQSFSWGLGYQGQQRQQRFYVNETNRFENDDRWNAFIQHNGLSGYKLRLTASNLGNEREHWLRQVYQSNRSGPIQQTQDTRRKRGPIVELTLSRSF